MLTALREATITEWIAATNSHDTGRYLAFFAEKAVLDDPSVGGEHRGHAQIQQYFESWFVGLDTRTELIEITPFGSQVRVRVHFVGNFPEGEADGVFDITFEGDLFMHVAADLA